MNSYYRLTNTINKKLRLVIITITILQVSAYLPYTALAKDLGVAGHTFIIEEESLYDNFFKKLQEVDLEKINNEHKEKVRKKAERPDPVQGIQNTNEPRTYYYDPTYTLKEDIKDAKGNILHKAGIKINPLNHVPLSQDLIFIDGDNEAQVKYAIERRKNKQGRTKLILVSGSPLNLGKQHKFWFYFDQNGLLTSKFRIKQVPALVTQDKLRLKIEEIKLEEGNDAS